MNEKEKDVLRKAAESRDGQISPASMINGFAGGDQGLVERLVSQGYLERVYQFREGIHHATYSIIFYAVTEKGFIQLQSLPKRTWFNFKHNIAVWIGVFTIIFGALSLIFTTASYVRAVKADIVLNRPYLFIDDSTFEKYSEDNDERYRIVLKLKNEGNSAALNANMSVFVNGKNIKGSASSSAGMYVSPHDENTAWILLSSDSLNLIERHNATSTHLVIQLFYEDLSKKTYCIETKHSLIDVAATNKLALDGSGECNNK